MVGGVSAVTFSAKYKTEEELLKSIGLHQKEGSDRDVAGINLKLATLREISSKWIEPDDVPVRNGQPARPKVAPTAELPKKAAEAPKKIIASDKKIIKPKAVVPSKEKASEKKVMRSIIPKTPDPKKPVKKAEPEVKNPAKKRLIPKAGEVSGKKPMRKIIPNNPPKGKK